MRADMIAAHCKWRWRFCDCNGACNCVARFAFMKLALGTKLALETEINRRSKIRSRGEKWYFENHDESSIITLIISVLSTKTPPANLYLTFVWPLEANFFFLLLNPYLPRYDIETAFALKLISWLVGGQFWWSKAWSSCLLCLSHPLLGGFSHSQDK